MVLQPRVMSSSNHDDEVGAGEDENDKSLRKRERERQRRTEMAGAFNELAQLLAELDPDNADTQSTGRRRRRRGSDTEEVDVTGDSSGTTRLLLISRATSLLRSVNAENTELRHRVQGTAGGRTDDGKVRKSDYFGLNESSGTVCGMPVSPDLTCISLIFSFQSVYVMVPTLHPVDDPRAAHPNAGPPQYPYYQQRPSGPEQSYGMGASGRPDANTMNLAPHQQHPQQGGPPQPSYPEHGQYYNPMPVPHHSQQQHSQQGSGPPYQASWPASAHGMSIMQQQHPPPPYGGAPLPPPMAASAPGAYPPHHPPYYGHPKSGNPPSYNQPGNGD